jgi:hypothetical protein
MRVNGSGISQGKVPPEDSTSYTFTNVGTNRAYNDGAINISFTPSPNPGKYAVTYDAFIVSGSSATASGSGSPLVLTGIPSGLNAQTVLRASNIWGYSQGVLSFRLVTTVPQAPTIGTATSGSASASVAFTAGATGGSAITGYTVTSSPGGFTGTGASSPITVSGLTNGTAYTFTVTATNANGTSLASAASNSITPSVSFFAYLATTSAYYGSCVTSDGIYTIGQVAAGTSAQVLITRFNFDGTVNWQRTLDKASQTDVGWAIVADSSGNVYAFGRYYKDATDTLMSFMAKYNSSGTLQYQKRIDLGATSEQINDALITSAGDIYASGGHTLSGVISLSVLKLNTTPTVSWARTHTPGSRLSGTPSGGGLGNRGIAVDSSGNSYTIANGIAGTDPDQWNVCMIAKYNSSGTVQSGGRMNATFGSTSRTLSKIVSDGTSVIVTGVDSRNTLHSSTLYVAKLASDCITATWVKAINTSRSPDSMVCSSTGDIYVATTEGASSDQRILIFKYNSSGTLQWQRRIDITTPASNSQNGYSLTLDEAKQKLIIAGRIVANVFVASLPTDGSGTGTYTVGSYTVTYDIPSFTSSDLTTFSNFTATTASNTDRTATVADSNMTGATSSFTASAVSF